ncbi:MAG: zonular occludens toxin domain-containing protein [Nitrospirae bacterium YQR-1]
MIHFITGKPGGGKSYYAVYKIVEEYFVLDKESGEYKKKSPVCIVSNIDNFKLKDIDLRTAVSKHGLNGVFNESYIHAIRDEVNFGKDVHVIYVVDEAQVMFPADFKERDILTFFEYHRHYGMDIWLITQNSIKVTREIRVLSEYMIVAIPISRRLNRKKFQYKWMSDKDLIKKESLPIDNNIFSLYTSFVYKPKSISFNIFTRVFVILVLLLILLFVSWKVFKKSFAPPKPKTPPVVAPTPVPRGKAKFYEETPEDFKSRSAPINPSDSRPSGKSPGKRNDFSEKFGCDIYEELVTGSGEGVLQRCLIFAANVSWQGGTLVLSKYVKLEVPYKKEDKIPRSVSQRPESQVNSNVTPVYPPQEVGKPETDNNVSNKPITP